MKCRVLLCALVALLPSLSSCDDDETAPPVEPQPVVCRQDTPTQPLICMVQALAEQVTGKYALTLGSDFVFSPTTDDSLDAAFVGTGVFDNWDKTVESNATQLLFDETGKTILNIGTPTVLINKTQFVRFELDYSLDVQVTNPWDKLTYRGTAHVDVNLNTQSWYVTAWRETEQVPGFSTWGYLRGTLRTRLPSSP